jgi:hypothetical protein
MKQSILISLLLSLLSISCHAGFVARDIAVLVDEAHVGGLFKILSAEITEYDYQGATRCCGLIVKGRLIDPLKGERTVFEFGSLYFLTLWPGRGEWPSHVEVIIVDSDGNEIINRGHDKCTSLLPPLSEKWIYTGKIHEQPVEQDTWIYWLEQPYAIQSPELESDLVIQEPSSLSVNGKVIENRHDWFEEKEFPLPRYYWDDTGYFKWSEIKEYVERYGAEKKSTKHYTEQSSEYDDRR